MVLEQIQILTTQNLAQLVDALGLAPRLRELGPGLADRSFDWLVRRMAMPIPHGHAALHVVKNAAYAWRQAIFYLSFADVATQRECVARLAERASAVLRLAPAVEGLARVVDGGTPGLDDGLALAAAPRSPLIDDAEQQGSRIHIEWDPGTLRVPVGFLADVARFERRHAVVADEQAVNSAAVMIVNPAPMAKMIGH